MKTIPFDFVLERLAPLKPYTNPMFGCLAVYVGEKIVLILRRRDSSPRDNGVWLATTEEHHESLRREFPNLRSIAVFGSPVTGWQVLAEDTPDFEAAVERACELVLEGDARIGKVPGSKKAKKPKQKAKSKAPKKRAKPKDSAGKRKIISSRRKPPAKRARGAGRL
jgi:hypothetical protein